MAENTVVKEQLTDAMIDAGAALTEKLDEMGVPITAAFWLFDSEVNEWRLVFVSPDAATKGPREVHSKIGQASERLREKAAAIPWLAIRLMDAHADLVRDLRVRFKTGDGVSRIRFSKDVINGHYFDDTLIYRVA